MFLAFLTIALIALLHLYILVLEMFMWGSPRTQRIFGHTAQFAQETRVMAANQGLYNGFLSAGLLWGLLLTQGTHAAFAPQVLIFFLTCIAVAGLYGAWTVSKRIVWVQTAPALVAIGLLVTGG